MDKESLTAPSYLQDFSQLVGADGVRLTGNWYHGTASGLQSPILTNGLIGGGDAELTNKLQGTLKTIGHQSVDVQEPVFLTQSKELAYFWAQQKAHTRSIYFGEQETPIVIEAKLPLAMTDKVKPDAGGMALLLEPGNLYFTYLRELYKGNGHELAEEENPLKLDRSYFLNKIGLAYCNDAIPAEYLSVLGE